MKAYRGTLEVMEEADFTAEVTHLSYDNFSLTLVLECTEISPKEPNWEIDCSLPSEGSIYRGEVSMLYATDCMGKEVDESSPATLAARLSNVDGGLSVDLRLFQHDVDPGNRNQWHLTGILHEA